VHRDPELRRAASRRRRYRRRRTVALTAVSLIALSAWGAVALVRRYWPGQVRTGSAAAHGASIVRYSIHSRFVAESLPQTASSPAGGGRGRPLLVFLAGRGSSSDSNANDDFFAALRAEGKLAPNVLFPSGGDHSYFHRRADGDWGRYILEEAIPEAVRRLHADPARVAIGGISMGGFGAFDIARLRPSRFCAVGGHSAAMWLRTGDTAPGAFDDAADFARNDLVGLARERGREPWGRAQLWLDGGTEDPFRTADEAFAAALGIPIHHWPGEHSSSYWYPHFRDYLRFYANALATC
jgi:S-formylglutathione hydrolase FrmB